MYLSKIAKHLSLLVGTTCLSSAVAVAQDTAKPTQAPEAKPPHIHVVYFGGNDCPPCVAFRGTEFVKLQKSAAFSKLEWTFVTKAIRSPIPSNTWLPDKIKPMRDMLIEATGGRGGSAQVLILVDGKVHDVYFGSKDADFYEQAVAAILDSAGKTLYPGERCLRRDTTAACTKKA